MYALPSTPLASNSDARLVLAVREPSWPWCPGGTCIQALPLRIFIVFRSCWRSGSGVLCVFFRVYVVAMPLFLEIENGTRYHRQVRPSIPCRQCKRPSPLDAERRCRTGRVAAPRHPRPDRAAGKTLLSPVAAWYIADILSGTPPPTNAKRGAIAYKTGTSYGFRDAWALGFDTDYTVGVWVGRPDGSPSPGHYGRNTAAPLLFRVFDLLLTVRITHSDLSRTTTVERMRPRLALSSC